LGLQCQYWDPDLGILTPWGPFPNLSLPPQPLGAYVRIFQEPAKTKAAQAAHVDFNQAAKALESAVALSPTQVRLRFQFVEGLLTAGDVKKAEREARKLLRLDKTAHRFRKLSPPHREQVQRWLARRQGN